MDSRRMMSCETLFVLSHTTHATLDITERQAKSLSILNPFDLKDSHQSLKRTALQVKKQIDIRRRNGEVKMVFKIKQ